MTSPARPRPAAARRSTAFLLAYALAHAAGVIGYLPLFSLLLPLKAATVAGDARIGLLTAAVVGGAIVASAANLLFGCASDRSVARGGGRRRWVAGGAVATALAYLPLAAAASPAMLVGAVLLFQCALNAALAPFAAIMADEVPDAQKGVAGGLLALANPLAAALSALLIGMTGAGEDARFAVVAAALLLGMIPLLATRARPLPAAADTNPATIAPATITPATRRDLAAAALARLLVQVAGSALAVHLLYFFERLSPGESALALAVQLGHLLTIGYIVPLPLAVALGRWSDRIARRKPFLLAAALAAAAGLAVMATGAGKAPAAAGFVLYTTGAAVFLALHAGFAMQLLPSAAHRGRDLGLLNLTNTAPALIGPLLTWWLATPRDLTPLFATLAVLTAGGGLAIAAVRTRR